MRHPADEPRRDRARAATTQSLGSSPASTADRAAPWTDKLAFFSGFVRHPREVGSVTPSSHQLERRLIRLAGIAQARTVVELGPGTGGTTRAFLRALPGDARLLAIELSPQFHERLGRQIRDPRARMQCGSAERIAEFLQAHGLPAPDAVVSGIPFSTMPPDVGDRIAAAVAGVLAPGGCFVAYQVRAHVARFTEPYLGTPEREVEFMNIPPMQVFRWTRRAEPGREPRR